MTALAAGAAYTMLWPVPWERWGRIGAYALTFPLHLLAFALVAAKLAGVALRSRARLAGNLLAFAALLATALALRPAISLWHEARRLDAPLSLGNYLANAARLNKGHPRADQSVVYATAEDGTELQLDVWRTGRP